MGSFSRSSTILKVMELNVLFDTCHMILITEDEVIWDLVLYFHDHFVVLLVS